MAASLWERESYHSDLYPPLHLTPQLLLGGNVLTLPGWVCYPSRMADLLLLDPSGRYKRVTVVVNPAVFAFLRHKGYTVVHSTPKEK